MGKNLGWEEFRTIAQICLTFLENVNVFLFSSLEMHRFLFLQQIKKELFLHLQSKYYIIDLECVRRIPGPSPPPHHVTKRLPGHCSCCNYGSCLHGKVIGKYLIYF